MPDDLILKQAVAVIDKRTTIVCLHVAGQIVPVLSLFTTLNGDFDSPPFHVHCRTISVPWVSGFVNDQRSSANAEVKTRPAAERRLGPDGYQGPLPPKPTPTPGPGLPTVRVTRSSLHEWAGDVAGLRTLLKASLGETEDQVLKAILKEQGFDGLPQAVNRAGLDAAVSEGWTPIYRGLQGGFDVGAEAQAAKYAADFKEGDLFVGKGLIGNGTYVATDRALAFSYAGERGVVLEMAMRPGAKIIEEHDLYEMWVENRALTFTPDFESVTTDPGRYAAMLGYDAIESRGMYVVLNRAALMVLS